MNKKLLSSCLVLSICVVAMAPISRQSNLNSGNTVHPITEWHQLNLEKVSSARQQLLYTDDTVTYPQSEEKVVLLTAKVQNISSRGGVTTKRTRPTNSTTGTRNSKSTTKVTANTTKKRTTTKATPSTTTYTKAATTSIPTSEPAASAPTTSRGISTTSSPKADAVISTAKNFIGVPYVWGGVTPDGFDCSGYTQYVLSKNGISVPRTASAQYTVGISVSKSNLRVGDLVFFTTYKAGASHLGFYIGDGNFIHASSSKGVTISSLSNPYYASHYIGARRVIY